MNFTQTPPTAEIPLPAVSPIIFQFYDGNYGNAGFYYEVKVYAWHGNSTTRPATPNLTIRKYADPNQSYRAWVNVATVAREALQENSVDFDSVTGMNILINQGAIWLQVDVQAIWSAGSSTTINSNIYLCTLGYRLSSESFGSGVSSQQLILTDKTAIRLTPDSVYSMIWLDPNKVTGVTIGATTYPVSVPTNQSNTHILGIELYSFLSGLTIWGDDTTIRFESVIGPTDIPISYDCTNKYGVVTVLYMNRYGVYEDFQFNGPKFLNMQPSGIEYEQALLSQADLTEQWVFGQPQMKTFQVDAQEEVTLNTGFIPENEVQLIQQIMLSRSVFIKTSTGIIPIVPVKNSIQVKSATNDKLIDYALTFKYGRTYIDHISR